MLCQELKEVKISQNLKLLTEIKIQILIMFMFMLKKLKQEEEELQNLEKNYIVIHYPIL